MEKKKKRKQHQQKSGKTAISLKTTGVSDITKVFAIICGITLGYREFGFLQVESEMESLKSSPCAMET